MSTLPLAATVVLQVVVAGSTRTVTLDDLQKKLQPVTLTVYNPVYEHPMTYEGFWLEQALDAVQVTLEEEDLVFLAADGYATSLSAEEIGRNKWLLAYGEPDGWSPLPGHPPPALPGPWYLVGRESSSYQDTPWPYQIVTIKVRKNW